MQKLTCAVQKYAWGNKGASSAVATLALESGDVDASTPYAELWMGTTHPNGPSKLRSTDQPLKEYLAANPNLISASP